MTLYSAHAPAKVNLSLHVGPVQDNGRHALISLLAFTEPQVADLLTARPASMSSLAVSGPYAEACGPARDNLVLKAARAMHQAMPDQAPHLSFQLVKNLPAAAGIGGGSADAAAALRLIVQATPDPGAHATARRIAPGLGGDVLACLYSQTGWMRGEGDVFDPHAGLPPLPVLLVNPGLACPTGPVFEAYDRGSVRPLQHPPLAAKPLSVRALIGFLRRRTRNDLAAPAIAQFPGIGHVLNALKTLPAARFVRMSGSGATCFAVFETAEAAHRAAAIYRDTYPDHWCVACLLGTPGKTGADAAPG